MRDARRLALGRTQGKGIVMSNFSPKTRRAIKAYGIEACREAFRMNDRDGEGASTVAFQGPATIKTTRQADAAIAAGREIAEAGKLRVRAFTKEDGHFEFDVSVDEWRAELPVLGLDCWSLPLRDYKIRAVYKKAAKITANHVLSCQLLAGF